MTSYDMARGLVWGKMAKHDWQQVGFLTMLLRRWLEDFLGVSLISYGYFVSS